MSFLSGFGYAIGQVKKKDKTPMTSSQQLHYAGQTLAMRALGWGTVYAVSGFSIFCFAIWKLMGVNNVSINFEM